MLPDPQYLHPRSSSIHLLHHVYRCRCLQVREPIHSLRLLQIAVGLAILVQMKNISHIVPLMRTVTLILLRSTHQMGNWVFSHSVSPQCPCTSHHRSAHLWHPQRRRSSPHLPTTLPVTPNRPPRFPYPQRRPPRVRRGPRRP